MAVDPRLMMTDATPIAQGLQSLGQGIGGMMGQKRQMDINKLAGQALMGDQGAMEGLAIQAPEAAMGVQKQLAEQRRRERELGLSEQALLTEELKTIAPAVAQAGTIQEAEKRIRTQLSSGAFPRLAQRVLEDGQLDEDEWAMFKDIAKAEGGGGPNIGTYNPRDYTTESFAQFTRSGDPSVLQRYEPFDFFTSGNFVYRRDPVSGAVSAAPYDQETGKSGQFKPVRGNEIPQGATPIDDPSAGTIAPSPQEAAAQEKQADIDRKVELERRKKQVAADVESEQAEPLARQKLTVQLRQADNVMANVDEALDMVGIGTAGPVGTMSRTIPGSPARDLSATLDTIKANLGFDKLQQMRDLSPTGGALGQVSEMELKLLNSAVEQLDQELSPEKLRENLKKVQRHYKRFKDVLQQAFDEQYGEESPPQGQPTAQSRSGQQGQVKFLGFE